MTMDHSSRQGQEDTAGEKKNYEKPSFQYEEVFVTSALSCAKAIDQSTCMFQAPRSS
jgi:hypothetical protein